MSEPADLARRWADAELAADTAVLAELTDDDFRGVGPLGFVLDREQWLRRFADGLEITALTYEDLDVREHGDVAVVTGLWTQTASYREHRSDGRYRTALVLHRPDGRWSVLDAHIHGPLPGHPPGPRERVTESGRTTS